jgi:hypothetical protein
MGFSSLNIFNGGKLQPANRQISGESAASRWMNGIDRVLMVARK